MNEEMAKGFADISKKLDLLKRVIDERIDKLRDVIYNYLEAGSNIALSTVKANLKSI